ncbi:MAG: hypothetical protein AB8G18_03270 [Gammaproteobacteria bacterium]
MSIYKLSYDIAIKLTVAVATNPNSRVDDAVAYDLKNLLWVIQEQTEVVRKQLNHDHSAQHNLTAVFEAVGHCTELSTQLLNLGRPESHSRDIHNLNDIVSETGSFLSLSMPSNVKFTTDVKNSVPDVYVNKGQLTLEATTVI